MSANIHQTTSEFDFSKIHLADPVALQGGSFHSKVAYSTTDEPLYIVTPQCLTKQGIITSGNKRYTDLMFTTVNNNFIAWVNTLEETLQQLIFQRRDSWFASDSIELDDIQTNFTPILKIYKGINYVVRSYMSTGKNQIQGPSIPIFNENEAPRDVSCITNTSKLICILEIQGVKFTQRSFHVTILIKQLMILENIPLFNTCIISPGPTSTVATHSKEQCAETEAAAETQPGNGVDEEVDEGAMEESIAPVAEEAEAENTSGKAAGNETVKGVTIDDAAPQDIEHDVSAENSIISKEPEPIDSLGLVELDTDNLTEEESISLKKPTEVYEEIYREARRKAIEAKKFAISAYLTANRIKELYSLDEILDSDEDDLSDTEIQKLET